MTSDKNKLLREEKELKLRIKQKNRRNNSLYFIILMVFLCAIYIADEITSNIVSATRTGIITDLFVGVLGDTFEEANGNYGFISLFFYLIVIFGPLYKSLADRIGRKLFLAINTFFMGISLLLIMFATNIYIYFIGLALIQFFVPNDMQVMYIMESAPEKHRVKLSNFAKALGLAGVSLIGFFRMINTDSSGVLNWRGVFLIPMIIALSLGVISYFYANETPVFIDKRINYLMSTDEEREAELKKKEKEKIASKGKTIEAFKLVFRSKQLRVLAIAGILLAASTGITSYYEPILNASYSGDANLVNIPIFVFPIVNAITTVLSGFLIDYIGRKKSTIYLGSLAIISMILFVVGATLKWPLILVGIFYGMFLGGVWTISDLLFIIIPGESTETGIRSSVIGALSLIFSVGCGLAIAITSIGSLLSLNMGLFCILYGAPLLIISILLVLFKTKETKGTNLEEVEM